MSIKKVEMVPIYFKVTKKLYKLVRRDANKTGKTLAAVLRSRLERAYEALTP